VQINNKMKNLNIYIGYDSKEDIAYRVCKYSLYKHSSTDIKIYSLKLQELVAKKFYSRTIDPLASTEFTYSRFLVPALTNYKGWAIFCDCDFIFFENILQILENVDDTKAVYCVQHDYTPKEKHKMDGQKQTIYPRKNWSSMVLWNCGHPSNEKISVDLVNNPNYDGKYFHRFSWLKDEEIGKISHEWNWLVGWYTEPEDGKPNAIHYTEGGPWFKNYRNCEYGDVWKKYLAEMMQK